MRTSALWMCNWLVRARGCENQLIEMEVIAITAGHAREVFAEAIDESHIIDQIEPAYCAQCHRHECIGECSLMKDVQ